MPRRYTTDGTAEADRCPLSPRRGGGEFYDTAATDLRRAVELHEAVKEALG
jgi:hypothetical protein